MKLLFVVTAFYPEQAIGSVRLTKFVKFLDRAGHDISILSLKPAPWALHDESLHFPALDSLRWSMIPQSSFFQRVFMGMRSATVGMRPAIHIAVKPRSRFSLSTKIKLFVQFIYTLLKAFDWMIQVRYHALDNLKSERFDAIFTSYPSLASPFSGLMLRRMGLSSFLIIDFRDPISYGISSPFNLKRFVERWFVSQANITSYASEGVFAKINHKKLSTNKIAKIITNGFDRDDLAFIEPVIGVKPESRTLRFAYVGSLYGGKRDITPFFLAISEALRRHPDLVLNIEFHYAGLEGAVFQSQAAAHGMKKFVVDHGQIPRKKSLGLQQDVDVCLIATWNSPTDQGILTGKIFEVFMLRKPIVAIVNGSLAGSEIKRLIDKTNAGICIEVAATNDISKLVDWLETIVCEKYKNGKIENQYTDEVHRFDIENLTLELFTS